MEMRFINLKVHDPEDIEIIIEKRTAELESLKPIRSLEDMYREHDLEVVIDALKFFLKAVKSEAEVET